MYKVFFSWEAQEDLNDIMEDYDLKKYKGGLAFFAKLDKILVLLEANPHVYAKKMLHFRRAFIQKSPFILYYQIIEADKDVEVLTILHNKRGADFIKRKLKLK